jgi:hypothetical protein
VPPNNAIQRTAGARRSQVKHMVVGGAPAAADGERWADNEKRKGHTRDGGENCNWGEKHPGRSYAVSSTGRVTGVWSSGEAECVFQGCSSSTDPAASSGLASEALGTWVVKRCGQRGVSGVWASGEAESVRPVARGPKDPAATCGVAKVAQDRGW